MPTAVPVVPVLRNPCSSFMVLRISLRAVKSPPAMAMHIRAVAYLPRWRGLSAEADWGWSKSVATMKPG